MVKLDEDARNIVEEARMYEQEMHKELLNKQEKLKIRYEKDQKISIKKEYAQTQKDFQKKKDQVEKETQQKIIRIEKYFSENEEMFKKNIYSYCLEGEEK